MNEYIFIVGSPRSGTTVIGKLLNSHPQIATWFVPYFMWEKPFRHNKNDILTAKNASPDIIRYIQDAFRYFKKKTNAKYIVDQSPRNSLRIGFIKKIFPDAKFVHVVRESKDAILSINKEWQKRIGIYQSKNTELLPVNIKKIWKPFNELLSLQPLLKHKFQALLFELYGFSFKPEQQYNRKRWNGNIGWGPRFNHWQKKLESYSLIEFNAMQWKECTEAVRKNLPISSSQTHTIQYERMLDAPETTMNLLLEFIDKDFRWSDLISPPKLIKSNYNKWKKEFTLEQIDIINNIIQQ